MTDSPGMAAARDRARFAHYGRYIPFGHCRNCGPIGTVPASAHICPPQEESD